MARKEANSLTSNRYLGGRAGFVLAVVLLNVLITSLVIIATRWPTPGAIRIEQATAASPGTVTVIVGGQVAQPGVYTLSASSTAGDALQVAGGAISGAQVSEIDLDARLSDGQQIWVGGSDADRPGETVPMVDINSATAAELESLSGIGPTLASRIVAYREEHGPFSTVEELLNVNGIGEATLEGLRAEAVVR